MTVLNRLLTASAAGAEIINIADSRQAVLSTGNLLFYRLQVSVTD
jgi:hypothetical protein